MMMNLPIPTPADMKKTPWYISNWTNDERAKKTRYALAMTCVPQKVGMDSGSGFRARPFMKFPTEHIIFEYDVFFPKAFDFVKGGKLPGIGLGTGDDAATGGDWEPNAGSVRIMWRENGQGIGYVYFPTHIAKNKSRDGTIQIQNAAFKKAAEGAIGKHAGIDLFFKQCDGLQFKKGAWNTVRLEVKLNAPTKDDGFLDLTINGVKRRVDGVVYRTTDTCKINIALCHAFFGGSTMEWSAPKKETISFKNFRVAFP